ncbi:MAG: hypothetical protein CSA70_10095 [Rhodobacterales bacterium]|nr:MAG: hypothetical protein CSA70_10095 [Rhodobacterales bacterium]
MSNVIKLNILSRHPEPRARHAALLSCFARHRQAEDNVFWLKENAELLNILECTGASLAPDALAPLSEFYETLENRLAFFPQYYRFLLSICLDMEDLGYPGNKGEMAVNWACRQGLAGAELSDLQRAEARRLMLRRGRDPMAQDPGLDDRLRGFTEHSDTFAMPNKKAAYELTHIVFYLSEYGREDPELGPGARRSLGYVGTLAFLDQDADLLAEVCVAMGFAGIEIPDQWEKWLARVTQAFDLRATPQAGHDHYHEYLVCNWAMIRRGTPGFEHALRKEALSFRRPAMPTGPLRQISELLFHLEADRREDWQVMKPIVEQRLDLPAMDVLHSAERAVPDFDRFFAGFSRAAPLREQTERLA